MSVQDVVFTRRWLGAGIALARLQLVEIQWWQGLPFRHRLTDPAVPLRDRLTRSVEKVAAQVLPATHASDNFLNSDSSHAAVACGCYTASITDGLLKTTHAAVLAPQSFE
jgi:hypothetical protein